MSWVSTVRKSQFSGTTTKSACSLCPQQLKGDFINLVTPKLRHIKRIRLLHTEKECKNVIPARQHMQRPRGEAGLPALNYSLAAYLHLKSSIPATHRNISLLKFIFPTGKCTAPACCLPLFAPCLPRGKCLLPEQFTQASSVGHTLALPWPLPAALSMSPEQVGQGQGRTCFLTERKKSQLQARKEGGSHPSAETLPSRPCYLLTRALAHKLSYPSWRDSRHHRGNMRSPFLRYTERSRDIQLLLT